MATTHKSVDGTDVDLASFEEICQAPDFRITTSLRWPNASNTSDESRYDGIKYHHARLLASATTFGFTHVVELLSGDTGRSWLADAVERQGPTLSNRTSLYKLTISLSRIGDIAVTGIILSGPLYDFAMPKLADATPDAKLYLARQPIDVSPWTIHKTNHRPMYASARVAAGIDHEGPTSAEVLLYNHNEEVMEASVSTVYFHRNCQWITPASSCGGNLGSTRSLALDKQWCIEGIVRLQDIVDEEIVVLSNGVRGFWPARIRCIHQRSTKFTEQ